MKIGQTKTLKNNISFEYPADVRHRKNNPAGKPIIMFLYEKLKKLGIETITPYNYEDFAWMMERRLRKEWFLIVVGAMDAHEDHLQWLIGIDEESRNFFFRYLGLYDERELKDFLQIIYTIIKSNRSFKHVVWYTHDEWCNTKSPRFMQGSSKP